MRLLFSSFFFFFTLVVGAILFVVVTLNFPGIMNQLIDVAGQLPSLLRSWGLPDSYAVWLNVLVNGGQLVLLGFVLVTRIVFALIGAAFGSGDSDSAFDRWGR
jgi:hypothetical protein